MPRRAQRKTGAAGGRGSVSVIIAPWQSGAHAYQVALRIVDVAGLTAKAARKAWSSCWDRARAWPLPGCAGRPAASSTATVTQALTSASSWRPRWETSCLKSSCPVCRRAGATPVPARWASGLPW